VDETVSLCMGSELDHSCSEPVGGQVLAGGWAEQCIEQVRDKESGMNQWEEGGNEEVVE
jgi:hypothetical protein